MALRLFKGLRGPIPTSVVRGILVPVLVTRPWLSLWGHGDNVREGKRPSADCQGRTDSHRLGSLRSFSLTRRVGR